MTTISDLASKVMENYYNSISTKDTSSTDTTSTEKAEKLSNTSLQRYLDSTDSSDVDTKTMFSKISIDLGGDGKSITKDQLDSYISSAENGDVSISNDELTSLKTLQEDWDAIAGEDAEKMTYFDIAKSGSEALTSLISEEEDTSAASSLFTATADATAAAYSKVVNAALSGLSSDSSNSSSSSSGLSSLLNTLLTGNTDEHDDANADLIANLTNLLAASNSTVEKEA